MTEHEVFWSRHQEFVARQDAAWERHDKFVAETEAWRREQRERDAALDKRIADLVSGIGEFMRRDPDAKR